MESKKINQLATELTPALSDLTIIGDPTTGISKKITLSQMASLFTGTVEEYASVSAFPLVGVADTIYIALDTNVLYRWDTGTNAYVELSPNIINSLVFNDANGFDGTISLVGSVATLTITTALTQGSVGFIGASGALLQDNANFFWDDTNNRLGIGTNVPTTAIDAFGSGIIGRLNGTSTNNSFLGFASAGTNKWSIGNVQSDHRFRIYSEANTAELVSVLQTGEFGIGISNPTTKLHIDGGASALIANLDANVSVAKSISFRSDNSNRINLEVSGTESGSNAGANFFLRTYTDAGSLIETPLSIVRSTGVTTIKSLTLTNALSVPNGGTGITSLTAGYIPFGNGTSAFSSSSNFYWETANNRLWIDRNDTGNIALILKNAYINAGNLLQFQHNSGGSTTNAYIGHGGDSTGNLVFINNSITALSFARSTGAATFANNVKTSTLFGFSGYATDTDDFGMWATTGSTGGTTISSAGGTNIRFRINNLTKAILTNNSNLLIGTDYDANIDYRLSLSNAIFTKSYGGSGSVTTNMAVPGSAVSLFIARGYNTTNGVAFSVVYSISVRVGGGGGSDIYYNLISQTGVSTTFTFDNNGGFLRINPSANTQWSGNFFGTL